MAQQLLNKHQNTTNRRKDLPKIAALIFFIIKMFDKEDKKYIILDVPKIRKFVLTLANTDQKYYLKTKPQYELKKD